MPTSTSLPSPTKIPLADIDLEPLLVLQGDLPPGTSGSQIRGSPPAMFNGIPQPTSQIYQAFERDSDQSGGVAVLLYDDIGLAEDAYAFILDGMRDTEDIGLGDRSALVTISLFGTGETLVDLLWMKCHAVVHVRISGDSAGAIAYGERLDSRLEALVCQ